jgi:uncharacterized protein YuzE
MGIAELKEIDVLLPYFIKHKNIWSDYDAEADTLYIHFKKPNNSDNAEMTNDDIIIRYENSEVIGLTILHASKRGLSV